jgi:hypothetical protein
MNYVQTPTKNFATILQYNYCYIRNFANAKHDHNFPSNLSTVVHLVHGSGSRSLSKSKLRFSVGTGSGPAKKKPELDLQHSCSLRPGDERNE